MSEVAHWCLEGDKVLDYEKYDRACGDEFTDGVP